MPLKSSESLFLHDLSAVYAAEKMIARILPILASEVKTTSEAYSNALLSHEQETRQQIERLEDCFRLFKRKPGSARAFVVEGLEKDHESALAENPSKDVLVSLDLGAAAKTEHYEIVCYHGLAERARMLDNMEAHRLLSENMKQEQEMLYHIEKLSHMIGQASAANRVAVRAIRGKRAA